MVKSYTFEEKDEFSKKGIQIVDNYLMSLKKTISVKNVENDPNYQKNDIDLVWVYKKDDHEIMISIEVKTDKYTTGNFWLETISNKRLNTPGCFIKSKAKYIFYYFIKWDCMYIIPLKKAIPWFLKNIDKFRVSETTTKDNSGEYRHTTVGRIVPISIMIDEIKEIKRIKDISKRISNS